MRIGLNLLYLIPGVVGGTETYAVSLIRALAARDARHEFTLFLNAESADLLAGLPGNFRRVVCGVRAVRRASRYAYEQAVLPARALAAGTDLLHSLGYVGPLAAPCPHVVTIHDLNFVGHAEAMPAGKRRVLRAFVEATARRARHVITVSDFSRRELERHLGWAPAAERITVTHEAGRPSAAPSRAAVADVRARYGIDGPYVVAFGSSSPHKNLPRLVQAFRDGAARLPHALVLVGHLPADAALGAAAGSARVIATGYVPDADVMPLLGGADLFAFPSLYEGFGLPLLDAQRCGVPVVCSDAGALPEIAGDGALRFDPRSVESIAHAIRRALADDGVRDRLRRAGLSNAARFTWDRTARETLAVYERVARGRRTGR
jgi:glycosyltransferase involved in cell wall biosynthesis